MSELGWIGLLIYFLSIVSIVLLASTLVGRARPWIERRRNLVRKVAMAILIICAAYWYITVPYIGTYYDFSAKLSFPTGDEFVSQPEKYLRDHHSRIEDLERELKEQVERTRQLREHYQIIVQLGFYGILYFGCMLIFTGRKPDETDATQLKLNDE